MATSAASMRPHSICKIDDLDEREEDVASVPGGSVAAAAHSDLSEWYCTYSGDLSEYRERKVSI